MTVDELSILSVGVASEEFKKSDVESKIKKSTAQISRILAILKEKHLINTISENGRKYSINYFNKNFISVIASRLRNQTFLPEGI